MSRKSWLIAVGFALCACMGLSTLSHEVVDKSAVEMKAAIAAEEAAKALGASPVAVESASANVPALSPEQMTKVLADPQAAFNEAVRQGLIKPWTNKSPRAYANGRGAESQLLMAASASNVGGGDPRGVCDIVCDPGATPEGEPICADGYNDTYNTGCNVDPAPPILQPISCGDIICGTSGTFLFCEVDADCPVGGADPCCQVQAGPGCGGGPCEICVCAVDPFCCTTQWDDICVGETVSDCPLDCPCTAGTCTGNVCQGGGGLEFRDTDWFVLTTTSAQDITATVEAEFDVSVVILDFTGGCVGAIQVGGASGLPCTTVTTTALAQPAGTYVIIVFPSVFTGVPCGAEYELSVDCVSTPITDCFPSNLYIDMEIDGVGREVVWLNSLGLPDPNLSTCVQRDPPPYVDGQTVQTEMLALDLTGNSGLFGPVNISLNPALPSTGALVNVVTDGFGGFQSAPYSYFDVLVNLAGGAIPPGAHTKVPHHVATYNVNGLPPIGNSYDWPICRGDLVPDDTLDGRDIQGLVDCYLSGPGVSGSCGVADLDEDGDVDDADVDEFVSNLLAKLGPCKGPIPIHIVQCDPLVKDYSLDVTPDLPVDSLQPAAVSIITVPDAGVICDVNVDVNITHTWISDFQIDISHGGTTVTIWDNLCGSNDNVIVDFDDEGLPVVCATPTTGTYIPSFALSAFDGMNKAGDWTLTVSDTVGGDSGFLHDWGLTILNNPQNIEIGRIYSVQHIVKAPITGACCVDGICQILTVAQCNAFAGSYQGDNVPCSPDPCVVGACCNLDGSCSDGVTQGDCEAAGGTYQGNLSVCSGVTCPPGGACCHMPIAMGQLTCTYVTQAHCTGVLSGTWLGANILCDGANCPDCNGNGTLDYLDLLPGGAKSYVYNDAPLPLAIPDNNAVGVSDVRNVPDTGIVYDLDVDLVMTHSWSGDTCFELTHNGTTVQLIERMAGVDGTAPIEDCYNGSPFGCSTDNLNVVLDDEGTGGAMEACPIGLASPPNYTPYSPLSAFDGMPKEGDWTLTVRDNGGGDTGTLIQWSLHFHNTPPVGTDCDGNGTLDECEDPNPNDVGACCVGAGGCQVLSTADCATAGGTFLGGCTDCSAVVCGACCDGDGICTPNTAAGCAVAGGTFVNGDCTSVNCLGACCMNDGSCINDQSLNDCVIQGGIWQGPGSLCEGISCPPGGACCIGGVCFFYTDAYCQAQSGVWQGAFVPCSPDPCATGACCTTSGTCIDGSSEVDCLNGGGIFHGGGTLCSSVSAQCTEACCVGGVCQTTAVAGDQCGGLGGNGFGPGSTCVGLVCNDACDDATPVTVPSSTAVTFGTTESPNLPICGDMGSATFKGVWYSVVGNGNTYQATTCDGIANSGTDTKIDVWTGPCTALTCVTGDDDFPSENCDIVGGSNFESLVTWCSEPGVTYYIRVGTFAETTTISPPVTLALTDLGSCSGSCCVSGVCSVLTSTSCAAAGGSYGGNGSDCDPDPCVSGACCLPDYTCQTGHTSSSCAAISGTYRGDGSTCATPCPPSNDLCGNCKNVSMLPFKDEGIHFADATIDLFSAGNPNPTCDSSSNTTGINRGIWYCYTPASNCTLVVNRTGTPTTGTIDTFAAVFTGTCGALTQVDCEDAETLTFAATAGVPYTIVVGMWGTGAPTSFLNVTIDCVQPVIPPNDACANCTTVPSLPFTDTAWAPLATNDVMTATTNPTCDTAANGNNANRGVWYCYTPSVDCNLSVMELSTNDVNIVLYTGDCAGTQTHVSCSDPDSATLSLTGGVLYHILICRDTSSATAPTVPYITMFGPCTPTAAACCMPDGSCQDGVTPSACAAAGGVHQGAGTLCSGVTCPQPCPPIPPGLDIWSTACGGSQYEFGGPNPPIPADFFGPGSDPFTGIVQLRGTSGFGDTTVMRQGPAVFSAILPSTAAPIPIELVSLSLTSCNPITVTFNGGMNPTQFDVFIDKSPAPASTGTMTITRAAGAMGGTFDSSFGVFFDVTAVPTGGGPTFGPMSGGPSTMTASGVPWLDLQNPPPCGKGLGGAAFAPGHIIHEITGQPCCVETCHQGPSPTHMHCTTPADCNPCPPNAEACATCFPITEGSYSGSTVNDTGSGVTQSCGSGTNPVDEWFCYTASCTGTATATTCDGSSATGFDTVLTVRDGSCAGAVLACNDDDTGNMACTIPTAPTTPRESRITFAVTAGNTYYIQVAGFGNTTVGGYTLTVSCAP